MEEKAYEGEKITGFYVSHPHREEKFYTWKKDGTEMNECKKRTEFWGGRVKGSEVERGGMEKRKIKAHGVSPSGDSITFLWELCNTVLTL